MNDVTLFGFERDFVATLRCIPMAVRFKLDRCGIKLSLRQWSRFTQEDRRRLLLLPCGDAVEVDAYRAALVDLVRLRADEAAKPLPVPPCRSWERAELAPVVADYARDIGVPPPSGAAWTRLTELQRFVLVKLTRDNHDNVNFVPAMLEFGLGQEIRPAVPGATEATAYRMNSASS